MFRGGDENNVGSSWEGQTSSKGKEKIEEDGSSEKEEEEEDKDYKDKEIMEEVEEENDKKANTNYYKHNYHKNMKYEVRWMGHFDELKTTIQQYGVGLYFPRNKETKYIKHWMNKKKGKRSSLSDKQIKMLHKIGLLAWKPNEERWMEHFNELKDNKKIWGLLLLLADFTQINITGIFNVWLIIIIIQWSQEQRLSFHHKFITNTLYITDNLLHNKCPLVYYTRII